MRKRILRKIKIIESGGLLISLDYLTIGEGNPKTLIISGMHGTERTGNLVIAKLLEDLPEFIGTLTILPIANPLGYAMGQRQEPLSDLDLNRQFTGKNDGRPAFMITNAIMKLAQKYDFVIDLHNYPTAGVIQVGFNDSPKAMKIVLALKPDVIRASHTEKEWKLEGTLSGYLKNKGIPAVLVELPTHRNVTTEQCERIVNGIKSHLIMGDKNTELTDNINKIPHIRIKTVKSPNNGVFYVNSKYKLMDHVKKDEILGCLVEISSGKKTEILSPYNGIICEKEVQNEFPTIAGNSLFGIGELLKEKNLNEKD